MERYDAANTLIGTPLIITGPYQYTPGGYVSTAVAGLALEATDYVQVRYQFDHTIPTVQTSFFGPSGASPNITVRPNNGSVIRTSFVTGGGYVAGGGQARIVTYEYERAIDVASWLDLQADPKQAIQIGGGQQAMHTTHVSSAERNIKTGATTWKVVKRP